MKTGEQQLIIPAEASFAPGSVPQVGAGPDLAAVRTSEPAPRSDSDLVPGMAFRSATLLEHAVAFDPADPASSLSTLPEGCGLFALFAEDPKAEPYLAKASHLRRRLQRFLRPAPSQTRRLQLAGRIRRIEYTETGSDFASDLAFYEAATAVEDLPSRDGLHS